MLCFYVIKPNGKNVKIVKKRIALFFHCEQKGIIARLTYQVGMGACTKIEIKQIKYHMANAM